MLKPSGGKLIVLSKDLTLTAQVLNAKYKKRFPPCTACVQWIGGVFSASRGFHQCIGVFSVLGDIMSALGRCYQCIGGI